MSMCGVLLLLLLSPLYKVFAAPGDGHLSGVPLEKDGSLNGNYVQETLFGGDREGDYNKLGLLFDMADRNKDKRLSERELQSWILTKTQEHMDESDAEVHVQFLTVDPDRDGFVTWTEFGSRYLEGQELQEDEILNILHQNLSLIQDANVHKVLSEMWESWRNADENPTDGRLSEEEFSTFLHPEHSRTTLLHLARSILQNLDKDGDGKLNEAEFSRPTSGDYSSKEQEERAQEFRLVIDSNKDGHASASEMEEFLDPLNEHTALKEARHMIAVVDRDHDGFLERSELLAAGEYFTGSKFMDFLTRHEDL